jgi:SAM-dependent methyltransferase
MVELLRTCYQVSIRWASQTLPGPRSTFYYRSRRPEPTPLRHRINLGCGTHYFREWNNLDLNGDEQVYGHDLRQLLPNADHPFDAVYCSPVLEHLTPDQGKSLVREIYRVLAPKGVGRIVVPDLEQICREYLHRLAEGLAVAVGEVESLRGAIKELLEDPAKRQEMAAHSRRLAEEEFSLEVMGGNYARLYQRILSEAPSAAGRGAAG